MTKTFVLGQKGASLLQIFAVMGVLTFAGMVIQRSIQTQKQAAQGAASRDSVEQLHDILYAALQNQSNCRATLTGAGVNPDTAGASTTISQLTTESGSTIFRTMTDADNWDSSLVYMNNNVRIVEMRYTGGAGTPPTSGTLRVTYEKNNSAGNVRTKNGFGGKRISKDIRILIQRTYGGTYTTCFAVIGTADGGNEDAMKNFCEDFGETSVAAQKMFSWDSTNKVCKLNDHLCYGKLFVGIDSTGAARCVDMEQWLDVNNIIDPTGSSCSPGTAANIRFVQVGTKVRIDCGAP